MRNLIIILFALLFSTSTSANVIGSDYNNFNPTTDGLGYVTTESGEFFDPGEFNLGLFLDYASNSMPRFAGNGQDPEDTRTSTNLHAAMGIMPGWHLGFSMTNLIQEEGNDTVGGNLSNAGREAFRLDSKIRLRDGANSSIGLLTGVNFNNIDNNPYLGSSPGPGIYLGGFFERYSSKAMRWAANLGYKHRNAGDAPAGSAVTPIDGQIFYSVALAYHHRGWDTHFISEIYGSSTTSGTDLNMTDRSLDNLEVLFGAKKNFKEKLDIHLGFTRGITEGLSEPEFRLYTGINYYFDSLFEKKYEKSKLGGKVPAYGFKDKDADNDGVPDADDYCPDTPKDRLVDRRGCPIAGDYETRDDDFDGVDNLNDQCPNTKPETVVDDSGCEAIGKSEGTYATMDSDGDGVTNDYDLCPGTAPGVRVTSRGCESKKIKKIDLGNLNFITGTAKLTKKSRKRFMKKIDGLYKIRKKIKRIAVEGHTDNVGKRAYNQGLSDRRSKTIRRILIKQVKISGDKVTAKGYGEDRPIASNKTKKGRLANRRVEMNVISY